MRISGPATLRDRPQPVWSEMVLPVIRVPKGPMNITRLIFTAVVITIVVLGVIVPLTVDGLADRLGVNQSRYLREVPLPGTRGRIVDRNGLVLASSYKTRNVLLSPALFRADAVQRAALAKALGIRSDELASKIAELTTPSRIAKEVDDARWAAISTLGIPGIGQYSSLGRSYPEGEAASHLVGFVNTDGSGQEGIELAFQKELREMSGMETLVRGRLGQFYRGGIVEAINGRDIQLAVDSKIQSFAYQRLRDAVVEHKAKAGSVIVLDTVSGELLAVVNYPSYEPSDRQALTGAQLRNRALTDVFEPGSTVKPFVVAQALESHRVTVDTVVNTAPGSLVVGPLVPKDSQPSSTLTVQQVIQKSSNIGSARLAMGMSSRELWEVFNGVGYGQKPQIRFPGAVTGRLKQYKDWRPVEQATMAYGYGLSASLLQMARSYTCLARDGDVIPVSVLKSDATSPLQGKRIFSPETAREMRKMLQMAAGPGGISPKAQTMGYSVGGESGTAHKQEGKGYAANKYRAWYVGIAPVSSPRIIVAVMIDEPSNGLYFGGDVAAPLFSQVVQQSLRIMNVPPDISAN